MLKQYSEKHESTFVEAVEAIREDMAQGTDFDNALSHYADLFQINEAALRHEWNLRNEDCR